MRQANTQSMKGMVWSRKGMRIVFVLLVFTFMIPSSGCPILWSYSIEGITALSVSENGNYITVGCEDGYYYIFDTWGNHIGSGHVADTVVSLDMADTGDLILGFSDWYTFCTADGVQRSSVGYDTVSDVSISSDGKHSLACSYTNVMINVGTSMVQELEISSEFPFGVISPDGTIACAASDEHLYIFDFNLGSWLYEYEDEDGEDIKHLFVSRNGEGVIFSTTRKIGYIDTKTGEGYLMNVDSPIQSIAATPTGDRIIAATSKKLIWLKGESVNELDIEGDIQFLSLINDSLAVLGDSNGIIQVITHEGTPLFVYDVKIPIIDLDVSYEKDLLTVCTKDSIYTFQLFQKTHTNTSFTPTASRKSLPLTSPLEEVWSIPVVKNAYFVTGDVDGDGLTEILLKEGTKLKLIDGNGNTESVRDLKRTFALYSLLDVDDDLLPEIPMTISATQFKFSIYDWTEDTVRDYYLGSLGGDTWLHSAEVMPLAVIDSDGDGNPEILADFGVGYSCKPRGMICYDCASEEIKWIYRSGTGSLSHVIADINNDGTVEIVLGSMAPCTCPDDEEYPDCDSYVTVLSITGEELWKVHTGHGFQRISVAAADVNEREGIEIVESGFNASETWGNLCVLSCTGEYLYKREFDYSIVPAAVGDIDGDGEKEIVTADTRGYLTIYTGDLQVKAAISVTDDINSNSRLYLNDFNGDGFVEIFLVLEKELFIFDKDLNSIWKKEFPEKVWNMYRIENFFQCKNTLLVVSDKLYAYAYTTEDSPCPLWEITERTLKEEGNYYMNEAESAFSAGEYKTSRSHYENALDRFEKLEDQEKIDSIPRKITEMSTLIFKQDVRVGMIFLIVFDGILCIFLVYSWFFRMLWSRLGESALLLSLPVLLGLFQVYYAIDEHVVKEYLPLFVTYTAPTLVGSTAIILRQNILGFARTVAAILSGHKNMLMLSIVKADGSYRVSVEGHEERFNPVKESRIVPFSEEKKQNLIKKVEYMVNVLNQISSGNQDTPDYAENVLQETGAEIYQNFIPKDFSKILKGKFLFIEVDDTEIPWELMYLDDFFALKYAISRRIISPEPVHVREKRIRKRRALIISDPAENLPGAQTECEIVYKRLKRKIDTVLVEGQQATMMKAANFFGQGFDIIHFAGHIEDGLVLSDGVMSPQEVREFIVGTPVVFINGCKSEELARAFLLGGATAYVGTIYPIHDESAADTAADFYDLCLQYRIGEALRRAREHHTDKDLVWASLIMYGDPTSKLL